MSCDNLSSALQHFEHYLRLARELEDADMEGRALVCCARTHMRLQQSTSAVQELHAALRIAKEVASTPLVEEVRDVLEPVRKLLVQEATESAMQGGEALVPVLEKYQLLPHFTTGHARRAVEPLLCSQA